MAVERLRQGSGAAALAMWGLVVVTACGSDEPGPRPAPTVESVIDECLIGTWKTVSQRQDSTVDGEPVIILDSPRTLTFTADGREVVRYVGDPAVVQDAAGKDLGSVTYQGSVSYRVSTKARGRISFVVEEGRITAELDVGGKRRTSTFDGASGPVDYTCNDTSLTQESDGYAAEFERS